MTVTMPMLRFAFLILAVVSIATQAQAVAERPRAPFDFAAAERNADVMLKRKPETPAKPVAPPVAPKEKVCNHCKGAMELDCPQHKTLAPAFREEQPESKRCKQCNETGLIVCPLCNQKKELKEKLEELAAKRAATNDAKKTALEQITEMEAADQTNMKLTGYSTSHFSIGTTLDAKLIEPCLLHGEGSVEKLAGIFNAGEFGYTTPVDTKFVLISSLAQYKSLLEGYVKKRFAETDIELSLQCSGIYRFPVPSIAVSCYEKINNAEHLQHTCVHFFAHFLLNRVNGSRSYPPWLEEGFATYVETLEFKAPRVYCMAYAANQVDVIRDRDTKLKKMAQENKPVPMEKLAVMTYMDMKAEEYFQAWSLVTMLIERDPQKFIAFVKALPKGVYEPGGLRVAPEEQEQALKDSYGYDYPKLLAVWRQWVLRP
jgi:hypothetical protein